jgi:hypothetical protein
MLKKQISRSKLCLCREKSLDILEKFVFFVQVNKTELETLRQEIAALKARLTKTMTKDLSLVTLVQNWTGTSASCGLQEFLNSVHTTADLKNWDEKDKVMVATLKLVDTARSFYDATPELHKKDIKWTEFKKLLCGEI